MSQLSFLRKPLTLFAFASAFALGYAPLAQAIEEAQRTLASVIVQSADPIVSAEASLLEPNAAKTHWGIEDGSSYVRAPKGLETTITPAGEGRWKISVQLEPEHLTSSKVLQILARSKNKTVIASQTELQAGVRETTASKEELPLALRKTQRLYELKEGSLEALVDVRKQRRARLNEILTDVLSDEAIEQLKKLEQELGLRYEQELSRDLPPDELAVRIGSIKALRKK